MWRNGTPAPSAYGSDPGSYPEATVRLARPGHLRRLRRDATIPLAETPRPARGTPQTPNLRPPEAGPFRTASCPSAALADRTGTSRGNGPPSRHGGLPML